jgi:hypothetical protein
MGIFFDEGRGLTKGFSPVNLYYLYAYLPVAAFRRFVLRAICFANGSVPQKICFARGKNQRCRGCAVEF